MKKETLTHILDMFYQRTFIPAAMFDAQQNLCFPAYSPFKEMMNDFTFLFQDDAYPIHIVHTYQLLGASFTCVVDGQQVRLCIGPCILLGTQINETIMPYLNAHVSSETLESFQDFCQCLYSLLHQCDIDKQKIPVQYNRIHKQKNIPQEAYEENLYQRRFHDETRDSYQFELRFLDYIKRGRKDKIDWIFSKFDKTYIVHLAQSPLENLKLKFASIVAIMTRTVISCGVPLDTAFSLSDALIQGLQNIKTPEECIQYIKYAAFSFCDLTKQINKECSALVNQCLRYIDSHLYEKITLQDLADMSGNAPVYISARFKQELQTTLSDYILERKIEEAKHLLLFTDHSYQEISTLLNFTSQSHFTQRFKQVSGQTPKQFRDKNFQYL